jgi:hypothetical protein
MCSMAARKYTLDVVVHEWALDLNISLENLSF